jgi:hypothetical protein
MYAEAVEYARRAEPCRPTLGRRWAGGEGDLEAAVAVTEVAFSSGATEVARTLVLVPALSPQPARAAAASAAARRTRPEVTRSACAA